MYTVREAKARFANLVEKAIRGEQVVISRGGKPVAKLTALSPTKNKRLPGRWKGKICIHPSFFDAMTKEELAEWGME